MSGVKHLHSIGIGGIGVSALARHFLSKGWTVSGCDIASSPEVKGVTMLKGHDPRHCDVHTPTMIVYSPAFPTDHPELLRAKELGIPFYSYPEALGLLARDYDSIAVSGTHGKSTTTALLSSMFAVGKKDPVTIVGARVPAPGFEENYRHGDGTFLIVEGCEYRRGMLEIRPRSAIITNVEADHLDYYKDLSDVQSAFSEYARLLPTEGVLVYNADDEGATAAAQETRARTISFGLVTGDLVATDMQVSEEGMTAHILFHRKPLGSITTPLVGAFNMMNILAAMAMAIAYDVPFADIARAVATFTGIGRRFECLGALSGTKVYSDYAHHPTALRVASDAAEAKFGPGKTLIVFQPHQIDRTKKLRAEFEEVFRSIPHLALLEIYFVAGREEAAGFSVKVLSDAANMERKEPIRFFSSFSELVPVVCREVEKYTAIVFVGAGDIDRHARAFLLSQTAS